MHYGNLINLYQVPFILAKIGLINDQSPVIIKSLVN